MFNKTLRSLIFIFLILPLGVKSSELSPLKWSKKTVKVADNSETVFWETNVESGTKLQIDEKVLIYKSGKLLYYVQEPNRMLEVRSATVLSVYKTNEKTAEPQIFKIEYFSAANLNNKPSYMLDASLYLTVCLILNLLLFYVNPSVKNFKILKPQGANKDFGYKGFKNHFWNIFFISVMASVIININQFNMENIVFYFFIAVAYLIFNALNFLFYTYLTKEDKTENDFLTYKNFVLAVVVNLAAIILVALSLSGYNSESIIELRTKIIGLIIFIYALLLFIYSTKQSFNMKLNYLFFYLCALEVLPALIIKEFLRN